MDSDLDVAMANSLHLPLARLAMFFVGRDKPMLRVLRQLISAVGYTSYAFVPQTPILPGTLCEHWSKESAIPAISQMAYDHLSIPVMSSEVERAFSGAKLNLPASRN